jgi:hypothetical protein
MGFLNGRMQLALDPAAGGMQTLNGSGWVELQEGLLVDLPVIRRFSDLARKMDSGFSLLSQNDFSMTFDIRNGLLNTEDARLDGRLLSLTARGNYSFPEENCDFLVYMKPFRDSSRLTRLARLLSAPVSRLFAFKLTGPLDDPSWRFANLSPSALTEALRKLGEQLTPETAPQEQRDSD